MIKKEFTAFGSTVLMLQLLTSPALILFGWNHFLSPLGLPMIGYLQALAIDRLISYIVTTDVNVYSPENLKLDDDTIVNAYLNTLFCFFILWILSLFI